MVLAVFTSSVKHTEWKKKKKKFKTNLVPNNNEKPHKKQKKQEKQPKYSATHLHAWIWKPVNPNN